MPQDFVLSLRTPLPPPTVVQQSSAPNTAALEQS
jgi:hypothetical protein